MTSQSRAPTPAVILPGGKPPDPRRRLASLGAGSLRSLLAMLLPLGATHCAARPCQCNCIAPQSAQGSASAKPAPRPAAFAAKPTLVWDGEGTGKDAKGWASCQEKTGCATSVEPKPKIGHNGTVGLEFKAKGPLWMGFGWNWFGWYPTTAGTDISKYKSLSFWIKVAGDPGKKPEPKSITVSLNGSSKDGKDETESVPLNDYSPGFTDGDWHKMVVPLEPMLRGKGETFDTAKAWAVTIGAWNPGEREYSIVIDDIEFS